MSTAGYNDTQTRPQLASESSVEKIPNLRLYYVRIHDVKNKLKVQAEFGDKIKFAFNEGKPISNRDTVGPVIYTLDLIVKQKNNEELYVEYEGKSKPIGEYRLRCSYIFAAIKTFTHEEKRDTGHSLLAYVDREHLFHFHICFHSSYKQHLPGKNILQIYLS